MEGSKITLEKETYMTPERPTSIAKLHEQLSVQKFNGTLVTGLNQEVKTKSREVKWSMFRISEKLI